ncbi:flavin reductase [Rhodoferax sp.]|uniref:flavin reductase n=1 Tax=Rhodoferax sp. TaxID=50421 RepID=UPI0027206131|nr:flavin reductase [Rhodoferax sp.]MDO8317982.1 flavin reductase [Rhodoferax sp.]
MAPFTVSPQEFRRTLAHYPTGVAVVTAMGLDDSPVSMVIGTFTSVSLDPPLVGFLADRKGNSWQSIKAAGHFCVSVLGAGHEHVCRAFATRSPDRFRHATAITDSGRPRLEDATLWVDCEIEDVLPAGDHEFVLGRVRHLGVGEEGGLPLLFLRGGYGAPRIASLQVEAPGLGPVLRMADAVRPEIEAVASEVGLECIVLAAVEGEVVMIAAAGFESARGSRTHVGSTFPLAAPLAPVFLAWASPEEQRRWLAEGARLAGADVTGLAMASLEAVRARGHEIATGRGVSERFRQIVLGNDERPHEAQPDEFAQVVRAVVERRDPALTLPLEQLSDVTALMVPVRDVNDRVVLSLGIMGFTGEEDHARLQKCLRRLETAADRATELIAALGPF